MRDAESENAAISDVDAAYQEVIAEQEVIAYETEHCETRGLKRHIDKLAANMASLQCGLESEGEWLRNGSGCPLNSGQWSASTGTDRRDDNQLHDQLGLVPDASIDQG